METRIEEVADRIHRFSEFVPEVGPTGFTFNQYFIDDEEPLFFHTGHRAMFPLVADAIATIGRPAHGRQPVNPSGWAEGRSVRSVQQPLSRNQPNVR
jgi:hypothetical protein